MLKAYNSSSVSCTLHDEKHESRVTESLQLSWWPYLRSHRIFNPNHSNACQTSNNIIFIVPLWLRLPCWEVSECQADGSETFRGHWLNYSFHNIITVPRSKYLWFSISTQYFEAPGKKDLELSNFNQKFNLLIGLLVNSKKFL